MNSSIPNVIVLLKEIKVPIISMQTSRFFLNFFLLLISINVFSQSEVFVKVYPKESTVYYGSAFSADIIILPQSQALNPEYYVKNEKINISKGIGEFIESAVLPQEKSDLASINKQRKTVQTGLEKGYYLKKINGYVKYQTPKGIQKKLNFEVAYTIVKPVSYVNNIQITSLYNRSANLLKIQPFIPLSFKTKNGIIRVSPTIKATNATVKVINAENGTLEVIPDIKFPTKDNEVKLSINYKTPGGIYELENVNYRIRRIPLPHLDLLNDLNIHVNIRRGLYWSEISNLKLEIEPEYNFKTQLPKEEGYRVKKMKINLLKDDYSSDAEIYNGPFKEVLKPKELAENIDISKYSFFSISVIEWIRKDANKKVQIFSEPSEPIIFKIR